MRSLSIAFVAAAIVSVGIKALVVGSDVAIDGERLAASVVALAEQRGMEVRTEPRFAGIAVVAQKGACEMAILPLRPSGEMDDMVVRDLAQYPRIRYYFAGSLSAQRPNFGPYVSFQWARALNRIGIGRSWSPLFAIGDSAACATDDAPLDGIRAPLRQEVLPD